MLSAAALGLSGLVAVAGPAAAAVHKCGDVIMASETLSNNVGPCPASGPNFGSGLIIGANNIVLDLGGHTITGSSSTNTSSSEQAGVTFRGVSNSTLTNGFVVNFDAGVQIVGGSGNTVSAIRAHDNINHSALTGTLNACNLGDGIVALGSSGNQITNNVVYHNGPFSGIALVDNSDNNVVSRNNTYNQTVSNFNAAFIDHSIRPGSNPPREVNPEGNGPCGPFGADGQGVGRLHQDIGIRVEGPGADNNQILNNQSTNNQLNGIAIHGYVCLNGVPAPPGVVKGTPNTNNLIQGNQARSNGFPDGESGIGILAQGPLGSITCGSNNNSIIGNTSAGNAGSGIYVTPTGDNSITSSNTVNNNITNSNGDDGIQVDGPFSVCTGDDSGPPNYTCNIPEEPRNGANNNTISSNRGTGNSEHDGHDGNPNCDANVWSKNIFGTVNQACVIANGGTGKITP
ncbi:MAG: right-handed parallel beta-helix repeat-containing protein [Actinobacteria bacterium]|nr:right-handed parallel beta-helix repeat-containing protein [Actinomycetota bacterium]